MRLRDLAAARAEQARDTRELSHHDRLLVQRMALVALEARRGGARPSLEDLVDPLERAAWVEAGQEYDREVASRIAGALTGEGTDAESESLIRCEEAAQRVVRMLSSGRT